MSPSGFKCMVWNTWGTGVWQRILQTLNDVVLLITSCEFLPWSARILEGFMWRVRAMRFDLPSEQSLLGAPDLCSAYSSCSQSVMFWMMLALLQQTQRAGPPSGCQATQETFPQSCPLGPWVDKTEHPSMLVIPHLGFHWVEFLWDPQELAFLLSSFFCWNYPDFESCKISGFRTPQLYL